MKIEIGPIELQYKQFMAMSVTTILAAQHAPPYSDDEINAATTAAGKILWRVKSIA